MRRSLGILLIVSVAGGCRNPGVVPSCDASRNEFFSGVKHEAATTPWAAPVPKSSPTQLAAGGEEAQEMPMPALAPPTPSQRKTDIIHFPPPQAPGMTLSPPAEPLPSPELEPVIRVQSTSITRMDYPDARNREPLVDALQAILDQRHQEAIELLKKYDPASQEIFLRLLPAVALLTKKKVNDLTCEEVAVLHEQLQSLIQTLRPKSKLTIAKACFCESVKGFGNFKPVVDDHAFRASTAEKLGDRVQLYVELKNFTNEPAEGGFHTVLATTVAIYDAQGSLKWRHTFDDGQQVIRTRTPLTDHHANYSFYAPPDLPAGEYRMLIRIEDRTRPGDQRLDEKMLAFRVTNMGPR